MWRAQQHAPEQASPRHASRPSLTATAEIPSATTGSSHHQPNRLFAIRPVSTPHATLGGAGRLRGAAWVTRGLMVVVRGGWSGVGRRELGAATRGGSAETIT